MPLQRRIPKRGFKNRFAIEYAIINLKDIVKIQNADIITPEILVEKGIIKDLKNGIKVLGNGDIQRPLTIKAHAFSASAISKISAAGGKAEVV
jgi:large subunit ribosomal protein L15